MGKEEAIPAPQPLLNETVPDNVEALLEAARYDDIDDVVSLASAGIPLDSKDSQGRTALHMAAGNGHLNIVEYLVRNGVGASKRLDRFLLLHGEVFCSLLRSSKKPALARRSVSTQGLSFSYFYLWLRPILMKQTLEFPVNDNLNASNVEKNTPLHWACLNGHIEVVKNLILAGANVTILNCYERTPMDEAVSQGKMEVIDAINAAVTQLELNGVRVS